ncbi:hypothetical protein BELL_0172g00040 [Botrytis elliptica]|uniref:AB hydrolase-1 domain-containing protein n=1 Tax=Botrytis elliptica TaxID=278938 RepID=A0A4Z1JR93_9HELO|nr:hypothetical protein BELL_0172g00040 [Botrytis elliptica]
MASSITSSISKNKATIVVVQGSFHTPVPYEALEKHLTSLGHLTIHPTLPSCTNIEDPAFPSITLIDDALAVRLEIIRQVEYENNLVLVAMHSYGGLVGSEAIPEELTYAYRKARGLSGGVIHLYYFSAFILPVGQSVLGAFGESPNNDIRKTKLTHAAYTYLPSTYLICENDQAAPSKYQEMFATTAGAQVDRCNAGHSAMLSQTALLAEKISTAAELAIQEANKGT